MSYSANFEIRVKKIYKQSYINKFANKLIW